MGLSESAEKEDLTLQYIYMRQICNRLYLW